MGLPVLRLCFVQRKEKLLKKQHRQALMLDNMLNMDGLGGGRALRGRKPVTYTFGKCILFGPAYVMVKYLTSNWTLGIAQMITIGQLMRLSS